MKRLLYCLLLISPSLFAQGFVDVEGGLVLGTPYNTVRIPNAGGTTFDLANFDVAKTPLFYRLRAGWTFADRHTISALYAPLTVEYQGRFAEPVQFNGQTFGANTPIGATYTFNSYRLTYRYDFVRRKRLRIGAGFTAKIRDAAIGLSDLAASSIRSTRFPNVGFVPLLNFQLDWQAANRLGVRLEADALGAKQGRAIDAFAGVTYALRPKFRLKAGYRMVEGGADVDQVYNFTWINYAAVGVIAGF